MDQGTKLENEDNQSCPYCMRHSLLPYSIILLSTIKIFLTVAELRSGNETEVQNLWISGHNEQKKIFEPDTLH